MEQIVGRDHRPTLRLAADRGRLTDLKSSIVSGTPDVTAADSKSKCQSPGMYPRDDHMAAAFRERSGTKDASLAGPPKRPTTSAAVIPLLSMGEDMATKCGQCQPPNVAQLGKQTVAVSLDPNGPRSQALRMAVDGTRHVTRRVKDLMARMKALREGELGVEPFTGREMSQDEFAKSFGANGKQYGEWERCSKAPPLYAIANFAGKYKLSLDWLLLGVGAPRPQHVFTANSDLDLPTPVKKPNRKQKKRAAKAVS